jgi:hypothetical protein
MSSPAGDSTSRADELRERIHVDSALDAALSAWPDVADLSVDPDELD